MYYFPTSSALIEFLILALVEKEDSYGYEISQTIKLLANIKESTLYPILKKLENSHYLTTYSQEFQGRKRKYYSLTGAGLDQLDNLREEWSQYINTINDIIEGNIRHEKN
ncbi:transcriptional regulator, PadR family [Streptococcus sp. oral taxon 056 str. F0418]|uniref:PadR family transcriptional regulator n=1 Tax=Streptococcus TaxID=1301 RepID=UPI0002180893|nr:MULTISPECIES: PadR family transcriptional regulator [Streptococcus]EGP66907.1 transcriptional regulator, PadR family [Streptococcus sp. oral taxon 056 str. F0418]MBZ2132518.1 PadR family transcriptional regulator [Streptococcus gordonii]MBZ2140925.1 PadR family transcriptional regulator [Streptococcus gordonii]MBZ2143953.1 PadR family transcriptional regulator [Streptococcus gordonii]MBZ2145676.1 PadR family transcriptional regulator [Streptococcus gordonii]